MNVPFNFDHIQAVEFFVCRDGADGEEYWQVPVDDDVQEALREMLAVTVNQLQLDQELPQFEPGEKYGAIEPSAISLEVDYMEKLRSIYETDHFDTNADALSETNQLAFYFAIFHDNQDRKLIGVRRASQFKGTVRARNRLVSMIDDTLTLIDRDVFKLDLDFDYLISETDVLILRPSGFEYTAAVEGAVSEHADEMIDGLNDSVASVDFDSLRDYVATHRRAARLIASLHARADITQTSAKLLKRGCKANQIAFTVTDDGRISPDEGNEMAFLEYLDRRRYPYNLVEGEQEYYVASSRRGGSAPPPA
jgi:Domain of unknown function (DUF4868)